MQQKIATSVVSDLVEINKIVAQARDFSAMKLSVKLIPPEQVEFAAWSDASFANAAQWKSPGGYTVCVPPMLA